MPLLREIGYAADVKAGSTLKALLRKHEPDELERALRGLALLRDRGELRSPCPLEWAPRDTILVSALYANGNGRRPWFNDALDAWRKHEELQRPPSGEFGRIRVSAGA